MVIFTLQCMICREVNLVLPPSLLGNVFIYEGFPTMERLQTQLWYCVPIKLHFLRLFCTLYFASLIGSCRTDMPSEPLLKWCYVVLMCFCCACCNGAISVNVFLLFFFYFLPPSLIYPPECLFHSPSVHPRAISCSNRCRSFSIHISPFSLMLFWPSCLSLRLSGRIKLDLCPRGLWSPPLGSIFSLIAILDPEGLIFYLWFVTSPLL